MPDTPDLSVYTGDKAWETIWKWMWFAKEQWQHDFRQDKEGTQRALSVLLPELEVRSVLDCSCGLGCKTILLAEMGYEVEGSDGCATAVLHAAELAREEGHDIRFFQSRWDELGSKAGRSYDCVYNDSFAWILTRKSLQASARGIFSALRPGGKFIFQWSGDGSDADREKIIEEDLRRQGRFEALPVHERNGVRLAVLISREKTPDGVLGNRIHIVDDQGVLRIEVASVLDLCKWSWEDYTTVLRDAGFRKVYSVQQQGVEPEPYILNIAER